MCDIRSLVDRLFVLFSSCSRVSTVTSAWRRSWTWYGNNYFCCLSGAAWVFVILCIRRLWTLLFWSLSALTVLTCFKMISVVAVPNLVKLQLPTARGLRWWHRVNIDWSTLEHCCSLISVACARRCDVSFMPRCNLALFGLNVGWKLNVASADVLHNSNIRSSTCSPWKSRACLTRVNDVVGFSRKLWW